MSRKIWVIAAIVLALSPTTARADFLFTPSLGYPFGGDTLGRDHPTWSFAATWIDEEGLGLEVEVGYSPHFFKAAEGSPFTGDGSVTTLMPNILLTASPEGRVVPYLTFGAGLLRMHVISNNGAFTSTTREAGLNGGAGVFILPTPRLGIRGDLRYIRSFQNQAPSWTEGTDVDIAPGAFDFFRFTFGVTVRFAE
jgi:hypothetical protein